jgi:hypothetical protein
MKYDWNIKNDGDFCLNTAKCIPDVLQHPLKDNDICFNFSKGARLLIYVRKDANYNTSADSYSYTNIPRSPIKQTTNSKSPKTPKECPEGKVLNPKTGRFILDRKSK